MRTKINDLRLSLTACVHDVIVLTETNLQPWISSSELGFNNYDVHRRDRALSDTTKSSGGGVLVAVSPELRSNTFHISSTTEAIFVSLTPAKCHRILVGAIYIPPGQPLKAYSDLCETLDEVLIESSFSEIYLFGDFNIPCPDWNRVPVSPSASALINTTSMHGLFQVNHISNHRGVILDLIFTSTPNTMVCHDSDPILAEENHHPALSISLSVSPTPQDVAFFAPNLKKCNLQSVFNDLSTNDLIGLVSGGDVNNSCQTLCNLIASSVLRNSPMKRLGSSRFPRWFSSELRQLTILKKTLHRQYKETLCTSTYHQFSTVRSQCKHLSRICLSHYTDHIQEVLPNNPKAFWSFLKTFNKPNISPTSMSNNFETASDEGRIADMFADFFSSVFSPPTTITGSIPPISSYQHMSSVSFTVSDVRSALLHLDVSKGAGSDQIPPSVIKFCCPILEQPLTYLYNKSVSSGIFPEIFKKSLIIPIFKKGSLNDISNYRPIAILPVLAKVLERLVLTKTNFFFRQCISPLQHGFISGRSATTNLLLFQSAIVDAFAKRNQVDALALDFSKAFDKINHHRLVQKLQACGFDGCLLQWFSSYLQGRSLQVRFNSTLSREFLATSGVPQGSILGPVLFNIYINDLTDVLHCNSLLFADDLKLFAEVSSSNDCTLLQGDLVRVEDWCMENHMLLNADKCLCITYHRSLHPYSFNYALHNTPLKRVTEMKDLGVLFTSSLSWDLQVQASCNRAARNLGLIHRMSKVLTNISTLKVLYHSLVRPHLEYCSVVWSPHQAYLITDLERIQRRFLRLVGLRLGFRWSDAPTNDLASLLNLPSLEARRIMGDILFLHNLLNNGVDCPGLLARVSLRVPCGTRSRDLFFRPAVTTNYARNSSMLRMQCHGNTLPEHLDFFSGSLSSFRRLLVTFTLQLR